MAPRKSSNPTVDNAELEHSRGGATTRDTMDAGVPMTPGSPNEPIGPEDALGPGLKRGDYSDRIQAGPSLITEVIPEDERRKMAEKLADPDGGLTVDQAMREVPSTRLVPADKAVGEVGDAPGKGGVSTEAAREATAELVEETAPEA